jgi:CheY-like chemotaxis protein
MNSSSAKSATSAHKILLVDDVVHGMVARRTVLSEIGYSVTTAENGDIALALVTAPGQTFDVIVTDYKMPGMDGLELIRRVRECSPSTKIVLLSGWDDTVGMTEESTGADVMMVKGPTEATQLTRIVKNLLARRPSRKSASPSKKPVASEKKTQAFMVKSS